MSKTFSFLRAKDLIYGPAVRSYMMGEAPPAFDLLYWNGDSTNLPGRMAVQYLRGLCQGNAALSEGTLELFGETLSVRTWTCRSTPSPARPTTSRRGRTASAACADGVEEQDLRAVGVRPYRGDRQSAVEEEIRPLHEPGGVRHARGVAGRGQYNEGSWWPRWESWLASRSGKQVPARVPGEAGYEVLAPAPGTYVLERTKADLPT
jgi:polyhydroxyalkanoate synthase subunit PhaC